MNYYLQKSLEAQWKNASLSNNFIFCRVMSENLDLCKDFLEMLLNIQIERLELSQAEKTIDVDFLSKGVRFDVYVKDGTGRCFDIEMQTTDRKNLPKRARYYQGILDISNLSQGFDYEELHESYIIFLCLDDVFKKGLPIYTFRNVCEEDGKTPLNDGTVKVFCNARKYDKMPTERLRTFFRYLLENKADSSGFAKSLEEKVMRAKIPAEQWRTQMTLEQEIYFIKKHARADGYEEGYRAAAAEKEEAVNEALNEEKLANARKLKESGVSVEIISKCTGLSLEQVLEL
ncbi:Rpn family recombination-promoting nuclease/putative transposase [Treponema sp.]|uniref:Rpn family recombination-promoting nuclease/putative transposase n=1 Tax=Treponema sp. TaxID=166 RepID=UPI003F0EBF48